MATRLNLKTDSVVVTDVASCAVALHTAVDVFDKATAIDRDILSVDLASIHSQFVVNGPGTFAQFKGMVADIVGAVTPMAHGAVHAEVAYGEAIMESATAQKLAGEFSPSRKMGGLGRSVVVRVLGRFVDSDCAVILPFLLASDVPASAVASFVSKLDKITAGERAVTVDDCAEAVRLLSLSQADAKAVADADADAVKEAKAEAVKSASAVARLERSRFVTLLKARKITAPADLGELTDDAWNELHASAVAMTEHDEAMTERALNSQVAMAM